MVSLKDISIACGVSIATVSKALNNSKDISEKTRLRITAKAKEMGYLPNAAAKALKTRRTENIGVLFTDDDNSGLTHDHFAQVLDSFKRAVEAEGYDITFINCAKSRKNRMSYLEHARYRNFDGVVIANIDFGDPEVTELMNSGIPMVTIDYRNNNCISVLSDNVQGMQVLVEYIYQMGHRKIAFIHGVDSAVTRSRLSSFYRTAERLGLEIPDEYIMEAPYRGTQRVEACTRELLALKEPPTCIICPDDFAAFGAINVAMELGLRLGRDISIAGYDGLRIGRHFSPQLTTIRQDTEELGAIAGRRLVELIEKPKTTLIDQILVKAELFEGGTVGKIG